MLDTELKHYSLHRFFFFFFFANSLPANSAIIPTKINCYDEGDLAKGNQQELYKTGVYKVSLCGCELVPGRTEKLFIKRTLSMEELKRRRRNPNFLRG